MRTYRWALVTASISAMSLPGVASHAFADTATSDTPVEEQLVDTLTALAHGPYPGYRANHAKGIMATGTFHPAAGAADLSKAAHLRGADSKVLVRFSDGTGVPTIPDAAPNNVHGMAIRFYLPDGSFTDIVALSVNAFPAATPEGFLAFLKAAGASGPGAPKPTPMDTFLKSHPAAVKFVSTPMPAPVSFATQAFYGLDAFRFTNAKGKSRYARYRILPMAGEHTLPDAQAAKLSPDYLMMDLPARLDKEPVRFRITAQLAEKGDKVNDITAIWPDDRPQVELGVLTLNAAMPDSKEEEKTIMFSPLNVTDGIKGSDAPILAARPIAYSISFGRRNGQ